MKTKTRPVAVPMELIRISQDAARRAAAARLEKLGFTGGMTVEQPLRRVAGKRLRQSVRIFLCGHLLPAR